jgi:hypothetical protein
MAIIETVTGNHAVAITGSATAGTDTVGVHGVGDSVGVRGDGNQWHGVAGISESTIGGNGVYGANRNGTGVVGESQARFNAGVYGVHKGEQGWGVRGQADNGTGVVGTSNVWHGVYGETQSSTGGAGVWGEHKGTGAGVAGASRSGVGVWARSEDFEGVHAESNASTVAAIAAYTVNPFGTGAAIYGESRSRGPAGFFKGNVYITGSLFVNGRAVRLLTEQWAGDLNAYNGYDDDRPVENAVTIQVASRHITAHLGIGHLDVDERFDDVFDAAVYVKQIVSDSGVENSFAPISIVERTGVTSITFAISARHCFVDGYWAIDFWA